jgi:hypothetical protein
MEFDGDYVKPKEGDLDSAEEASSNDYCCNEMHATDNCFQWKVQDEVRNGKHFYTHSNRMAKYSDNTWTYWQRKKKVHYTLLKHGTVDYKRNFS